MKEENKGITLIALVITIIVLLILAGVTIAILTGDNGILTKANNAKTETTKAGVKEQVQIAVMGSYDSDGKLDYKKLKENLENIRVTGIPDEKTFPLTITIDGEDIEIKEDGTVKLAFNAEEWDKTACKESSFLWESDDPNSGEAYYTIIGYSDSIINESKFKIPSRCHVIKCNWENWSNQGREFAAQTFKTVELPDTVIEIGNNAFWCCNSLINVDIPQSVTIIGPNAFAWCDKLESVTIPNSVVSIGEFAFYNCINLSSVTIPSSVTSMGRQIFQYWTSSQTINIQEYSSAPFGWDSGWNNQCLATINWNQ